MYKPIKAGLIINRDEKQYLTVCCVFHQNLDFSKIKAN